LSEDRIILGDPASCVRQIERFQTELGLTHLISRMSVAGIPADAALASMDLFTREVIPALKGA
jgi:alkanesulfonate monooxygenase SsuD/methylene tetrahydromethanopterin reductase-like flavin-dependent oxidoreductase (luciferase family)